MKKVLALLLTIGLLSGVAFASGNVVLRATNPNATKLTSVDYRIIYSANLGDKITIGVDTLDVPIGTNLGITTQLFDVTAKDKVAGLDAKLTLGPGQLIDGDGAIVNRNYNAIELGLPLGITAGYTALTTNVIGNITCDEISASLPLTIKAFNAGLNVYDLRGISAEDILKAEVSTVLNIGQTEVGVRGGVSNKNANKIGATVGFGVLGAKCALDVDSVTGTYTQVGEKVRTANVLNIPIANGSQAASLKIGTKVGVLDVVATGIANSTNNFASYTTITDITASLDNLSLQLRDNGGSFARLIYTVNI